MPKLLVRAALALGSLVAAAAIGCAVLSCGRAGGPDRPPVRAITMPGQPRCVILLFGAPPPVDDERPAPPAAPLAFLGGSL